MVSRKEHTQVRAEVTERVTGNTATAVDTSCQFTSSLYVIQFKNTPKYYPNVLDLTDKNGEAELVATQRCPVYSGTHYSQANWGNRS